MIFSIPSPFLFNNYIGGFNTKKNKQKRTQSAHNNADDLTIDFFEKVDLDTLGDVITLVSKSNNVDLEISGFKVKRTDRKIEIFVNVSGSHIKSELIEDISTTYKSEVRKRENSGTVNYYFIDNFQQSVRNDFPGSSLVENTYINDLKNANISNTNVANTVSGSSTQKVDINNKLDIRQTLSDAVNEILSLLKQLEDSDITTTEIEKINYINENTTLSFRRRVIKALQAGGESIVDEFILKNKYFKVIKATLKCWLQLAG